MLATTLLLLSSTLGQTGIDAQENIFGATNIGAITGNGRLTLGISKDGDATVFSWPSPSFNDQLGYRSSNAIDARQMPRMGAPESAGVVLGLVLDLGDSTVVSWLRDGDWDIFQDYGPQAGPNIHTRFTHATYGLELSVVDAVHPQADVWVRHVTVQRQSTSPVQNAWLLAYANLSPIAPTSKIAELAIADWVKDGDNDFAAIWDASQNAILHFHPDDNRSYDVIGDLALGPAMDFGPVGDALKNAPLDEAGIAALHSQLDESFGLGTWLAMYSEPAPDQHQIGFDDTDFCGQVEELVANIEAMPERFEGFESPLPISMLNTLRCKDPLPDLIAGQGWTWAQDPSAEDAYTDAQDGELRGGSLAAGEVSEAVRIPFVFDSEGQATASLFFAASRTKSETDALRATYQNGTDILTAAENAAQSWETELIIPGEEGSLAHAVVRRSLYNLRVGTDRESGAIVASIARQPAYGLDWPRDGAFFNLLLDLSGQSALVEKRAHLYASWQRLEPADPTLFIDPDPPRDPSTGSSSTYPAFAWEMAYYADGVPGGISRFEIDTTAFALWTLVAHTGWSDTPTAYVREHYETIRSAADLLERWRDEETGLHAHAQEDDQLDYTQTLHGAIAVFGALDIAARAARFVDKDSDARRWEARAAEVRDAIDRHFVNADTKLYEMGESKRLPIQASGLPPPGPTAWVVWPFTLYPFDNRRIQDQLAHDYAQIRQAIDLETPGGLYFMKATVSLALAGGASFKEIIESLPQRLAEHATEDTLHFGEVMITQAAGDTVHAEQRVATPHLWEGSLFALTVAAAQDPKLVLRYDDVLPASRVLYPPQEKGCGCQGSNGPIWFVLLLAGLMWRFIPRWVRR